MRRIGGPPPDSFWGTGVAHLFLDNYTGGDYPFEDTGQDVVATDEYKVLQRSHVADRNHLVLAFLRRSRPAPNSSMFKS